MYNTNLSDSRLHYEDSGQLAPRINRKEFDNSSVHMKQVLQILRKNEHRLKMLTETSAQDCNDEDNS
jgi:hypothetical protein